METHVGFSQARSTPEVKVPSHTTIRKFVEVRRIRNACAAEMVAYYYPRCIEVRLVGFSSMSTMSDFLVIAKDRKSLILAADDPQ
jgi:ferritin-like protein